MESNIKKQLEREFDSTLINFLVSQGFLRFSLIDKSKYKYTEECDELHHRNFYIVSFSFESKSYSQLFVHCNNSDKVKPISDIIVETSESNYDD